MLRARTPSLSLLNAWYYLLNAWVRYRCLARGGRCNNCKKEPQLGIDCSELRDSRRMSRLAAATGIGDRCNWVGFPPVNLERRHIPLSSYVIARHIPENPSESSRTLMPRTAIHRHSGELLTLGIRLASLERRQIPSESKPRHEADLG